MQRVIWPGLFVICAAFAVGADDSKSPWASDPEVLIAKLKQRDAMFDNRTIEIEQHWVEHVSPRGQIASRQFDSARSGQPKPESPAADTIPDDYVQPHRLRRLLTVREPEVTIERREDACPMKHSEYVAIPNIGCRWSTAGGVERVWSPETHDLHILGVPSLDSKIRWDEHMIEWCCGYGFTRGLKSVDSVRVADDRLVVEGRMRLTNNIESRVEMQLDRELILRRAVVSIPSNDGGVDEYLVENDGTERPSDCPPMARSGRFRRTLKPAGKAESVYEDFQIRFLSASPRLTDVQYAERTRIMPDPKALVIDTRKRD